MPKRKSVFTKDLEKEYPFIKKNIIAGRNPDKCSDVICTICGSYFSVGHGGNSDIKAHLELKKHKKAELAVSNSNSITFYSPNRIRLPAELDIAAKECVFSLHTVLHDQSFSSMDCTNKLMKRLFNEGFKCGRTKCEAIVKKVLYPHETDRLKKELDKIQFISLSMDTSNHGNIKILVFVIRYFLLNAGVQVKVLDIKEIPGETSDIQVEQVYDSLNIFGTRGKIIALCGDNCKVNFGGVTRGGTENIYYKLKDGLNPMLLGVGCGSHLIHNCGSHSRDVLPVDIDHIVVKVFYYFRSYTTRNEKLKNDCLELEMEYLRLLGTSNVRWLALNSALDRFIQMYPAIKLYFMKLSKCPTYIKDFIENPLSLVYMKFLKNQLSLFVDSILITESDNISASEVAEVLYDLNLSLNNRKLHKFIGTDVKLLLESTLTINESQKQDFYTIVDNFFSTGIEYLNTWTEYFKYFNGFKWINLSKIPTWDEVEHSLISFKEKTPIDIDQSKLFEEFNKISSYCNQEKINIWNQKSKKSFVAQNRWCELFEYFNFRGIQLPSILKIVEFSLSVPGTSAPVERVFSKIKNSWTAERNKLSIDTIKCINILKSNVKKTCVEYYEDILKNENLLKKVINSDKYNNQ